MFGKTIRMFSEGRFFQNLHERTMRTMRQSIRTQVLAQPGITLPALRRRLILLHRLSPITFGGLVKVKPGTRQIEKIVEGERQLVYANEATFRFKGDPTLFKAWNSKAPSFMGEAEIEDHTLTRTYHQVGNSREEVERWARDDGALIKVLLARYQPAIDDYHAWVEPAIGQSLLYSADHIDLWRLEGELDVARLNARLKAAA